MENNRYLFKAKQIDWNKLPKEEWWVQGHYVETDGISYIYAIQNEESAQRRYQIDESTICQCIGFKDKNENLIWENDIVCARCNGLSGKGVVKFENGCFVLKDRKRNRTYSLFGEWKFRVDGNIFDNPELLEVE